MSDEIIFYTHPQSRGRIVHWMLEEIGATYRVELLVFEKREHKTPEYLRINPMGKVPAIIHRGIVVTETAAICAYLADAFPQAGLAPDKEDPLRGAYLRWFFFCASCTESALTDRIYSRVAPDRPGALSYGTYEEVVNAMEVALDPGPYILGERFTAVDVFIGATIQWGLTTRSLESRPRFAAYVERCSQRPAYQRFLVAGKQMIEDLNRRRVSGLAAERQQKRADVFRQLTEARRNRPSATGSGFNTQLGGVS